LLLFNFRLAWLPRQTRPEHSSGPLDYDRHVN